MRRLAIVGAAAVLSLGGAQIAAAEDSNVPADVTDAVTQPNVKVLGDAPAMAIGNLYNSAGQSTGPLSPTNLTQLVLQTSQAQGVTVLYSLDTASDLTAPVGQVRSARKESDHTDDQQEAKRIARMAERLADCGDECIVNLHIHVDPRRSASTPTPVKCSTVRQPLSPEVATQPAVATATCIAAVMAEELGAAVPGVALVVPDASLEGDTVNPPVRQAPGAAAEWLRSPVTSVDVYVQHRGTSCLLTGANPQTCSWRHKTEAE